jgi:enterochelin esterase family protein
VQPDQRPLGLISSAEPELALDRLVRQASLEAADIDAFLKGHDVPLIEGLRCTFLYRGEADEVHVTHRVVGLPPRIPLRRIDGTDLWYATLELPEESRVEYRLGVTRHGHCEELNDPLNPRLAHNPFGASSVCYGAGYEVPDWTQPDPEARPGTLEELTVPSRGLDRDTRVTLYLPARFRRTARYPLLVVHDGGDYLNYAAAKTVLDNLIHRLDVAEVVAAFTYPGDRLVEYPDHAGHATYIADELLGELRSRLPLVDRPEGRCLMGSSFGGVASVSTAVRHPRTFGALLVQSGSFVFTDIGSDHGGGPVFDPVVEFMNRYRARPRRVADRMFVSCGIYEPLIVPNRAMAPVFRATGMDVRYVESRDGHNWENWRDRLRDGLSWVFPGPQKYVYE